MISDMSVDKLNVIKLVVPVILLFVVKLVAF